EEINKSADQTGVRATFTVETRGMAAVRAGTTSDDFAINGVKIGQVEYKDGDSNGALVAAINSVKDTTGVEASIANGQLLLSSREGRGIKIEGSIGGGAFINKDMMENYGRLSLVKNDGKDILVSGTGLESAGFGAGNFISQASVSLRESKGRFDANIADAMGFGSVNKGVILAGASSVSAYMSAAGSGFSAGSGYSAGSGKNYSAVISANAVVISNTSAVSKIYNVSAGSGFSSQSGLSQFATMKTSAGNSLGAKDETAGVTTLKGAMAVMDIAETATTNLDQIRADIGSVQNQLQVTINNITVTQVNVKAAESTIRDVDFAAESANFSKYNILAQSGSYAMSQANAVQQNVLKLLQ
ncbi:flagellin, partial [Campylobacter coli]|nr:flagellin [Campylobacter coli]